MYFLEHTTEAIHVNVHCTCTLNFESLLTYHLPCMVHGHKSALEAPLHGHTASLSGVSGYTCEWHIKF